MDGNFNGYLGYSQGQQGQQSQQSQQQSQQQSGLSSFGNLSGGQSQHQDSSSHPTLPPLQGQNGYSFGSLSYGHPGSQSHTPTTPHTPATMSVSQSGANAYATMSPAHQQGGMLPPSNFNGQYCMSQSSMYPSSTATAMPSTTSATNLPSLRPMPPGGVSGSLSGLPSLTNTGIGQQAAFLQNEEAPTHVVGSQGRRGILPSAPGRPNPPQPGAGKSMIPQKDADGKYPCPHCNKTYLHAKHLKRHLLRHTGDRPYMCHLCKDTFSRSDILKRHFQKCSIRRGNPTGANHLAHQRNRTGANRLSISQQDGPIGLAGLSEVSGPSYAGSVVTGSPTVSGDISTRTSRANSLITPGNMSHRGSNAGLGVLPSNGANGEQMGTSAPFSGSLPAYAMQNAANGAQMQQSGYNFTPTQMNGSAYQNNPQMSFLGHQSSRFDNRHSHSPHQQNLNGEGTGSTTDWSRMFNQSGQDGFIGSQPANASSQGVNHIKTEPVDAKTNFNNIHSDMSNDSFLGSLYSHPGAFGSEYGTDHENGIPGFPNWSLDDPLQAKVDSLLHYCFPNGADAVQGDATAEVVKTCLTPENVKHLAEHYTSYHGHWPILHMPTFKLTDANNSLVMVMLCIGAVYSPKMDVDRTRKMMDFVKATVFTNCSIYQRYVSGQINSLGSQPWDVDEMQALITLQVLYTWHGDPPQRQSTRNELPTIVSIAKAMGLMQNVSPGHYAYSPLHDVTNTQSPNIDRNSFNWHGWLEQEKRNRTLFMLFLCDAASVMYFNSVPQLDPLEIRLMLPSDDAAWDARDQRECANALGLNGVHAQNKNLTGTRRPTQPSMRDAMRTLLEPNATFQPSATNTYAKFVLIHALIVRISACQKTLLIPDAPFQGLNLGHGGSGPATPLSQNDWLDQHGNGSMSATNSGHGTPTDGFGPTIQTVQAQQEKKRLGQALDKWKRIWDQDMEGQYPPGQLGQRRFGFSRDGVHFFFLGRSFLQSQRVADWTAPPDTRFKQVMALLKRIKGFVVGDNETKGHDIGSVGDIDDQYGLDDLTLDMKLLFKPYNSLLDSPVASVQTSL
ncbi:hypothetical protein EJ03DRAFT_5053 [Teratosphaeria nubilosa]|uniref:C2H2-type domain-containing protein n=1 Tax=Teratosphaeria nubilosa TaxID=161662 RepID=A0A6G1LMX8_9PEZI|nr:hypothetical protein EJ03DRAFT_5053 [Teratosphaeria nubilosa]